uniref:Putative secreted protein n=1 Tax=Ixodes ricinus TaxID=34613 RepID=A0A6B0UCS0_IXORI
MIGGVAPLVVGVLPQVLQVHGTLCPGDEHLQLVRRKQPQPVRWQQLLQPLPERQALLPQLRVEQVVRHQVHVLYPVGRCDGYARAAGLQLFQR